jgi:type IV pilus assembly protein PilO
MFTALLCIFAVIWLLYISPYLSQLQDLQSTIAASDEMLQQASQARARLKNIEVVVSQLTTTEQQISARLPQAADLDGLLTIISGKANESGLRLASLERQEEISREHFGEIPIKLSVSGRYHQVAAFFDALQRLSQLVVVSRFVARTTAVTNDQAEISVDCMLSAFQLHTSTQPSNPPQK